MDLVLALVKIALLVLGGLLVAAALRRAPAAARHDLWLLVVTGSVLLPVAGLALPPVYFPVSHAWDPIFQPTGRGLRLFAAVWAGGALVAALRLVPGLLAVRRMGSRAAVFDTPAARAMLAAAARLAGVTRPVRLLVSPDVTVPATWGLRRPLVALPAAALAWSPERLRLVLLHELVHVRRQDVLTELFLWAAMVAYWFHPAVWLAARQLRLERERACDEAVLDTGARASDYCEHLVEIMRAAARRRGVVIGTAMAAPSTLEHRVRALLDGPRGRRRFRLGAALLVAGAAAIYALSVAAPCAGDATPTAAAPAPAPRHG